MYLATVVLAVVAGSMAPANDPYVEAIMAETHNLDLDLARRNVYAARKAADKHGFQIEELLAQAWVESRFNPYDLSRIQCKNGKCKRRIGTWKHKYKPPGAKPTYYCGPMQVGGNIKWKRCRQLMHDLVSNYDEGAKHVRLWEKYAAKDKRCRKHAIGTRYRRTCAYRGYVGGWKGLYSSRNRYPNKIYWKQARIKRRVDKLVAERTKAWEQKISKESQKRGPNSDSKSGRSDELSWYGPTHSLIAPKAGSTSLPRSPETSTRTSRTSRLSAGLFYLPERILY
jgi:hypothetical protein